jgi:hypothetical protein
MHSSLPIDGLYAQTIMDECVALKSIMEVSIGHRMILILISTLSMQVFWHQDALNQVVLGHKLLDTTIIGNWRVLSLTQAKRLPFC